MNKASFLALIITLIGEVNCRADFTDYYSFPLNPNFGSFTYYANHTRATTVPVNNWSIFDNNSGWDPGFGISAPQITATASTLRLDSGTPLHFPGVPTSSVVEVSIMAPSAGFWSFYFTLTLSTTPPLNVGSRGGYYFVNGTIFDLPEGAGTVSNVFLNAGDTFGYGVRDAVYVSSLLVNANLQVTHFSAPVPEPQTTALWLLGMGVLIAWPRQKRI